MTDTATTPAKPATEVGNKTRTASRYFGTYSMGALTALFFVGSFSPDQQAQILASFNKMYVATQDFVGAAANVWLILFPAIAGLLAKFGIDASGVGNMMDRIFAMAKGGNLAAKVAIVNAAASPAIGTQAIVNPELAPLAATANNVVVTPAAVPAALPENPARPS